MRFGIRKTYSFSHPDKAPKKKKKKTSDQDGEGETKRSEKDYHYYRYCPMKNCTSLVKRLSAHLRRVHKLGPGDVKQALLNARGRVSDSHRVPYDQRKVKCRDGDGKKSNQSSEAKSFSQPILISESEEESNANGSTVESVDVNVPMHEVFVKFKKWMQSADGGQLDKKTTEQHFKQVSKLLSIVDDKKEVDSLYNDRLINEKFLEGYAKRMYHPKTIQSYLMSLRHFYAFSLTDHDDLAKVVSKETVLALKEKVTRWSSSFRHSSAKRHWEKMEEDFHALITPEQVQQFERSEAARDAICLLGQLSGAHCIEVTQAQYTLIRDFLVVEISIDNANRAGALANMKIGEFKRMKKEGEDNVILVKDHKTLATHGPARIILSAKLSSWVNIFVNEVRSKVSGSTNDNGSHVFLSWNGEALASSQISKAMKSVWKKAAVGGVPSSTLLRKSAVSGLHKTTDSNEKQGNLADLMAHNVETARKYYRLQEKSKSSVEASRQLRSVMRGEKQQKEIHDSEAQSVLSTGEDGHSKISKLSWDAEKEAVLQTLFQEEISQKAVNLETVRSKISGQPDLMTVDPKRVLDKVRSMWRYGKQPSTEPANLPSEQETLEQRVQRSLEEVENNSEIIPPSITSSLRNCFSSSELDSLRNIFSGMIVRSVPISKVKVKEILEKEHCGIGILKKVSLDTVVNRVKYERRLHRGKKEA